MLMNGIPIAIAIIFIAIASAILTILHQGMVTSRAKLASSLFIIWLFISLFPWLATWLYVPLINNFFIANPEFQPQSWDVAAALAIYLGMVLSYVLGVIGGLFATWHLVRISKKVHRAGST